MTGESNIRQFIESAIKESEPDIVITHHPADTNNDHMQTSMACQEAVRLLTFGRLHFARLQKRSRSAMFKSGFGIALA